jgi:hypothetical protein
MTYIPLPKAFPSRYIGSRLHRIQFRFEAAELNAYLKKRFLH